MDGAQIAAEFYAGYKHDTMHEQRSPGTWLYLFRNPQNGSTKIGISKDYENRRQGLSSSGGVKLRTVFAIFMACECDESAEIVEKFLHRRYKPKRIHGEWFNLNRRDVCYICDFLWYISGDDIHDNRNIVDFYRFKLFKNGNSTRHNPKY